MTYDDNVIDAEVVEVVETPNLPAVVDASNAEPIRPAGWVEKPPPSPRRDAELSEHPENRCVATKKDGERCRKYAIRGSTVCRTHGGATKHVQNRARVRVQNASDRLMGKLIEFAFDDAKPPDTQLRAIRDALDRAGMQPTTTVEIGIVKPYEMVFDSIGGTPSGESYSGISGYGSAGRGTDVEDVGIFSVPTQPHPANQSRPSDQARPRSKGIHADTYADGQVGTSSGGGPPQPPRPRDRDRDTHDQPPARHITGDAAMRAANWANAAMAESHGLPWGESARKHR